LDKNRFVKVREFRGKLFIDIREFYEKNGETLPGKKGKKKLHTSKYILILNGNIMFIGISLSVGQWNKLKEQIDDIQESVEKLG